MFLGEGLFCKLVEMIKNLYDPLNSKQPVTVSFAKGSVKNTDL